MWEYDYSTLCHHGILGQKWGVRRFQNPDGTLTEAGKKKKRLKVSSGVALAGASISALPKIKNRIKNKINYTKALEPARIDYLLNDKISDQDYFNLVRQLTKKYRYEPMKKIAIDAGKIAVTSALITYGALRLKDFYKEQKNKNSLKSKFISEPSTKKQNINDMDDLIYANKRKKEYNF